MQIVFATHIRIFNLTLMKIMMLMKIVMLMKVMMMKMMKLRRAVSCFAVKFDFVSQKHQLLHIKFIYNASLQCTHKLYSFFEINHHIPHICHQPHQLYLWRKIVM